MTAPASPDALRAAVRRGLRTHAATARALALEIYDHPEPSGAERLASRRCADTLAAAGFDVATVPGVQTAFVATRRNAGAAPTIGLLGEYDALPALGHACGHHLIAGAAVAAGLALADAGVPAPLQVFGCPSEETLEGKRAMLDAGAFADTDLALTFHAHDRTSVMTTSTGLRQLRFAFAGRPAHAGDEPWAGASALDGVLLTLQNVNALRQFARDGVRIHGVITEGGDAPNVVPERAACTLGVRSPDRGELERIVDRVIDCARAGALASGTELAVEHVGGAEPVRAHPGLAAAVRANLEELGERVTDWTASASTDFGDVSGVVPSVLLSVASWPPGTGFHTREATERGGEEMALQAMLTGALAMALTAVDVVADPAGILATEARS